MLVMVDVVEQQVDRGDALHDAALDVPPLLGREDARQHVEWQDSIDRPRIGVDRESDAKKTRCVFGYTALRQSLGNCRVLSAVVAGAAT